MRFMVMKKSRKRSNFHFSMTGIRKGFPANRGLSRRGKNERKERVNKRDPFSVKGQGLGPRGGASPYKTLLSTPQDSMPLFIFLVYSPKDLAQCFYPTIIGNLNNSIVI